MTEPLTEQQLMERARRRVSDIVAFAVHVIVYVAVNAGIWLIDIAEGGGVDWAYWTTIPWGVGVAVHGIVLVLELRVFSEDWRDRQVQNYVSRRRGDADES